MHTFPEYLCGSFTRFCLSFAQVVFTIGSVVAVLGGAILNIMAVTDGEPLLVLPFSIVSFFTFVLCYTEVVVVATTKAILFPEHSPAESTIAIRCDNGHTFNITKRQAGSVLACPACGIATTIPALSKL